MNAGSLQVPPDQYYAECAWVAEDHGGVSFLFGTFNYNDSKLKTRLKVCYSYEAFLNVFWQNSREFHRLMKERSARRASLRAAPRVQPRNLEVEKEHVVSANLDVISRAASEACIDFFSLSARCLAMFGHTKNFSDLDFAPVVRVTMKTDELAHLLDEAELFVEKIRPLATPEVL